jgi:hypothetical protein
MLDGIADGGNPLTNSSHQTPVTHKGQWAPPLRPTLNSRVKFCLLDFNISTILLYSMSWVSWVCCALSRVSSSFNRFFCAFSCCNWSRRLVAASLDLLFNLMASRLAFFALLASSTNSEFMTSRPLMMSIDWPSTVGVLSSCCCTTLRLCARSLLSRLFDKESMLLSFFCQIKHCSFSLLDTVATSSLTLWYLLLDLDCNSLINDACSWWSFSIDVTCFCCNQSDSLEWCACSLQSRAEARLLSVIISSSTLYYIFFAFDIICNASAERQQASTIASSMILLDTCCSQRISTINWSLISLSLAIFSSSQ